MKPKLVRITTIPLSLEKLLEGQLTFMSQFYEVTAISAEKERLEKYGIKNKVNSFWVDMTREITPFKDLKALFKLVTYLRKEKVLIVHTHTPKAGIIGMLAGKIAGVPIRLHTVAGLPLMETAGVKRFILNLVEKLTYALATKVYPNSLGLKEIILNENFAKPSKLKVLGRGSSNGIDTKYFNPEEYSAFGKLKLRDKLEIPQDDLVFIFIGRLVSEKGINELVAAFLKYHQKNNNIALLLVGPYEEHLDPLKPEILTQIEKHGKIFTTGYQSDVRPFLAASDVLAFPSYREGFPNVVMQAGAMNLPSIVSDINGCNEIITQGENGFIIPPKNEGKLYDAIKLLAEDDSLRLKMANNSREMITQYYERKEFWAELLKEYKLLEQELSKS